MTALLGLLIRGPIKPVVVVVQEEDLGDAPGPVLRLDGKVLRFDGKVLVFGSSEAPAP